MDEPPGRWLLLIHQIPPKPDYFRVKVRRRLQRLGALALKNSVYVLPNREETMEDFQWLQGEIVADGGEATLCAATIVAGISDAEIEELFRAERGIEYAEIARAAREIAQAAGKDGPSPSETAAEVARLRRRLDEAARTDFFDAPGRSEAERALEAADGTRRAPGAAAGAVTSELTRGGAAGRGRTWVTREGVFVDRIASAWLIRRFIDPDARFLFIPAADVRRYRPAADELRFDMYRGEYTHEGDRCTFETLLARFGLDDGALHAIAEVVHDIDCKDEKFGRPEAAGVASVLAGIARAHPEDADRLRLGGAVFDGLYAQFAEPGG